MQLEYEPWLLLVDQCGREPYCAIFLVILLKCASKFVAEHKQTERRKFAASLWKRCNEQAVPHDLKIIRVSVSAFLCKLAVFEGGSFGRLDRDGGSDQLRRALPPKASTAYLQREHNPAFLGHIYRDRYVFDLFCWLLICPRCLASSHDRRIKSWREIVCFCFLKLSHNDWNLPQRERDSRKVPWSVKASRWDFWKQEGNTSGHKEILFYAQQTDIHSAGDGTSSCCTEAANWKHGPDGTLPARNRVRTVAGFIFDIFNLQFLKWGSDGPATESWVSFSTLIQ